MIEKIPCLICGKLFTRPVSHVWQVHKLSAREYKQMHGLDIKRGIATKEYKEKMRDHVFANGTVNNLSFILKKDTNTITSGVTKQWHA